MLGLLLLGLAVLPLASPAHLAPRHPPAYLNSSLQLPGAVVWDVDCGNHLACNNHFPVCCNSEKYRNPYCVAGGEHCCVGAVEGCRLNETCCPSVAADGSAQLECCNASAVCEVDERGGGRCVVDRCRAHDTRGGCLSSSGRCGWCCATSTCQSARATCTADADWLSPGEPGAVCPDPCSEILDCNTCRHARRGGAECGWCCSSGRCVASGFSAFNVEERCSPYSWIPPATTGNLLSCSACAVGGGGLYHTQLFQSVMAMVLFSICFPLLCICLALLLCLRRCCHRFGYDALLDDGDEAEDEEEGDQHCRPPVTKYGFGDEAEERRGHMGSEGEHDRQATSSPPNKCALCLSAPANVVFLPCYHCYCCSRCSVKLERHAGAEHPGGALACPFCRRPIETMVNLDKIYQDIAPATVASSSSRLCNAVPTIPPPPPPPPPPSRHDSPPPPPAEAPGDLPAARDAGDGEAVEA